MSLGVALKHYLGDRDQKQVAMGWLGRMAAHTEKRPLAHATVPSRLSQLFADDPEGIRAFFRTPERATCLLDELGVPDDARDGLRALAEEALAGGGPAPRLVVDLSDQADVPTDALFGALRERFLGRDAILPLAVVLTDRQYEPRRRAVPRMTPPPWPSTASDARRMRRARRRRGRRARAPTEPEATPQQPDGGPAAGAPTRAAPTRLERVQE